MKQWNLWNLLLAAIALNFFIPAEGNTIPYSPYEWRQQGPWIELEADVLCWNTSLNHMDVLAVVTQDGDATDVKYKSLEGNLESGIKIAIVAPDVFHSWNAGSSYYRLHSTSSKTKRFKHADANNGIVSPMVYNKSNFANIWQHGKASSDLLYNEWDLILSCNLSCGRYQEFSPYFGLAGLQIQHEIEEKFSHAVPRNDIPTHSKVKVDWDLKSSAVGLRVGTKYAYQINSCLKFIADGNMSLLESNDTIVNTQTLLVNGKNSDTLAFKDDSCSHQVYGYHLSLGIVYNASTCGWNYKMHLGYELVGWYNLSNQRVFFGNDIKSGQINSSSTRDRTLSLNGLVAGCSMIF